MYPKLLFEFMYRKQLFDYTYRHQPKRKQYYLICGINIAICFCRMALAYVSILNGYNYLHYDVFARFAYVEMNQNKKLFLSFDCSLMMLVLFLFVVNYLFYRTHNFTIMDIAIDIGKANIDDFHESNNLHPPLQLNIFKIKFLQFVSRYPQLEKWLLSRNQQKQRKKYENIKFNAKLRFFGFLNSFDRFKVLVFFSILEAMLTIAFLSFVLFYVVLAVSYTARNLRQFSVLIALASVIDLSWIGWKVVWELMKMDYIMLCNSVIMCSTFIMQFSHINRLISQKYTTNNLKMLLVQIHTKVTRVVLQTGDENLSLLMYTFLVTNIPISVFFLTYIIYADSSLTFQIMVDLVVLVITVAFLVTLVPPALVNKESKKSANQMPRIQQEIKSDNLRLKLKYMSHYEQLTSNKIGFKVGPFGTITIDIIVQVLVQIISTPLSVLISLLLLVFINLHLFLLFHDPIHQGVNLIQLQLSNQKVFPI